MIMRDACGDLGTDHDDRRHDDAAQIDPAQSRGHVSAPRMNSSKVRRNCMKAGCSGVVC